MVTLAFAFAIEALWFRNTDIVGSSPARVEQPSLFGVDLAIGTGAAFPRLAFGVVCLMSLLAVAVGVAVLRRSSLGSAMLAVRANERSAAALGVNVVRVKVMSFALASFIAGLGGSLLAYRRGTVSYDSFTALGNLAVLSTGYLAGITSVLGGLQAGILSSTGIAFTMVDRWVHIGQWFIAISSVLLILTLVVHPEGIASLGHALAARVKLARRTPTTTGDKVAVTDRPRAADADGSGLTVEGLTVQYGGVVACYEVDLVVAPGSVVGLIGPNGAGKTSVIDAITGFTPSVGSVRLGGHEVSGLPTFQRVREGLIRSFQSLELYEDLSVEENVSVAAFGSKSDDPAGDVDTALELTGIAHLRDRPAGELSQGERQLVSIARSYAARPRTLLLDEPAAGLDTSESRWLGERIRAISNSGTGVVLVDHDVALVLSVCDLVYVLDLGKVIACGDAESIRSDRLVAAAYLGDMHELSSQT